MIINCTCINRWQDRRYGRQKRVMNRMKKATTGQRQTYRCTICQKEHEFGGILTKNKGKQDDPTGVKGKKKMVKTEKKGRVR